MIQMVLGVNRIGYQSIDWGGNSFAGEVLTVSTQPEGEPFCQSSLFSGRQNAPAPHDRKAHQELGVFLVVLEKRSMLL